MATIWIAYTDDPRWRATIPTEFEANGFQKIGPMALHDAEAAIIALKSLLEAAALSYTEQTCSDD